MKKRRQVLILTVWEAVVETQMMSFNLMDDYVMGDTVYNVFTMYQRLL